MAFFNLTSLGYQDPIRSQIMEPKPDHSYSLVHQIPEGSYVSFRPPTSKLPPINMDKYNHVSQPGPNEEHGGSYVKYTERLRKHTRHSEDPNELCRNPLTTSQSHGWWHSKDNPDLHQKEPWTHVPRHVHVSSEMTRFVKEMSQTNREFSLF